VSVGPAVIAHADWGSDSTKRWVACAALDPSGVYRVEGPTMVGDPGALLDRLFGVAGGAGATLVGFDFPIGIPARYAELAGECYRRVLPEFG